MVLPRGEETLSKRKIEIITNLLIIEQLCSLNIAINFSLNSGGPINYKMSFQGNLEFFENFLLINKIFYDF